MPVDTRIDVPFIPQEGITGQILQAIQLANEQHRGQQQIGMQQQQLGLQQQAQPSEIALHEAQKSSLDAQTQMEQANLAMRQQLMGVLTGSTPGAQAPVQPQASPQETLANIVSGKAPQPVAPAPKGGLIGQTVNDMLSDPDLTAADRTALKAAGSQALLQTFAKPEEALKGVVQTYNDIQTRKGELNRSIKIEDQKPDAASSTGYSTVATKADGTEAYRHPVAPPVPKTLEEASSLLGSATLNYHQNPTPGNKSAVDLYKAQHDAMYADHLREMEQNARASAMARGADVEAMYRTGKNPITKETLNLDNAPPSALVNPANGQVIPQDMMTAYKPTQNERQTADTARQVLAISQNLKDEVAKNPALIGPLAGRSKEALQKLGLNAADSSKMLDDLSFLQSAATKMHTGRFSSEILQKMGDLIKPGMNGDEFKGALESINDVATRYANEDKLTTVYEYQQRQQFESQNGGAAKPAAAAPAAASGGDFFGKFGGAKH